MLLQEAGKGTENNNNNKPQHPSETDENQSMALLWLIQLPCLVPKHRRLLQAQLSTLIELDFCVNCLKTAVLHHTFPECILENYQTCFVHYQEPEK